jgi:hypothetical protein
MRKPRSSLGLRRGFVKKFLSKGPAFAGPLLCRRRMNGRTATDTQFVTKFTSSVLKYINKCNPSLWAIENGSVYLCR